MSRNSGKLAFMSGGICNKNRKNKCQNLSS